MPSTADRVDPRGVRYVPLALWLIAHRDEVSAIARDVYAVLASLYNDDEGGAWPKQTYMAEVLTCTDRTIRRALVELEQVGLIASTRRGDGRSNFYEFLDHPWMHEHQPTSDRTTLSYQDRTPGVRSKDNLIQTSTEVLRTSRRAASGKPPRRSISSRADNSGLDTIDSPALGADQDGPPAQSAEQPRPKRARQRPADPAAWTAYDLGAYFVAACGKLAASGHIEGFVGVGSAKVVAANVKGWLASGVPPGQVKNDIDYFVVHYQEYAVQGAKPDKAFLAAAAVIRTKTMARAKADQGGGFSTYVHRPKGMGRASA